MRWVTTPDRTILWTLLLSLAVTLVLASHESHSGNRRNGSKGRKRNGGRSTTSTTTPPPTPQLAFLNETSSSSFFDGDDEVDVEAAAQHQQDQPPGGVETCEVARLKCAYRVGCGMALQVCRTTAQCTHISGFLFFVFLFFSRGSEASLGLLYARENVFLILTR